jgi:hypothetical protein
LVRDRGINEPITDDRLSRRERRFYQYRNVFGARSGEE